ncbi:UNVERIFIED_CONTAM: hypothetical protein FKN15_001473 [Acipenser sinensis]
MPSRFSPHRSDSPHGSGDPKMGDLQSLDRASFLFYTQELQSACRRGTGFRTKASPAGVSARSSLGLLASRARCRARRRNSPSLLHSAGTRTCAVRLALRTTLLRFYQGSRSGDPEEALFINRFSSQKWPSIRGR